MRDGWMPWIQQGRFPRPLLEIKIPLDYFIDEAGRSASTLPIGGDLFIGYVISRMGHPDHHSIVESPCMADWDM